MQKIKGVYISGVCKGIRSKEQVNSQTGEVTVKWFVGIGIPMSNGYEDQESVTDIAFSKDSVAKNEQADFNILKGKEITVPVNVLNSAYNGRAYLNYYYDSRRDVIKNFDDMPKPKAVNQ